MDRRERLTLIQLALGKVSVDFMRQSKDVVMPTEALLETASQIEEIWAQEIAALESQLADRHAERVREIDAHAERVAGLEAQLDQYRWRRVEDELPERFLDVLVVDDDGWHFVAYNASGRWCPNHPDMSTVTHWMPLPPAPEEGE